MASPPLGSASLASRPGVALTEDLIRRKAEHNDGMLSSLEEIALHQLDIDRIEVLNNCRFLKIVYLQSNLISRLENLNRLKRLEYLNVALNNIQKIENLDRCESLSKLDLTCNFIDLDELHTVGHLKNNSALRELFLVGNPATHHWERGWRDYVIGTLPQLEELDGVKISRSERIKALQRLPQLEAELTVLAALARERKAATERREAARQQRRERGEDLANGDGEVTDEWTPATRVRDARAARSKQEEVEAKRKGSRPGQSICGEPARRERRYLRDDGTLIQMNSAKWPFSVEDNGTDVTVDVALPKFLDSAQIDADVQPLHVRVRVKAHALQLLLPAEVLVDASKAERSATTGHLLLTCPKVHPIVVSKAPKPKRERPSSLAICRGGDRAGGVSAGGLTGSVDIRRIVDKGFIKGATHDGQTADLQAQDAEVSPNLEECDDDDSEDVPPPLAAWGP